MNYIIEEQDKRAVIYKSDEIKEYNDYDRIITELSRKDLFNVTIYNKYARKYIGLKYNIPIFFNENLILFKIKYNKKNYYINYSNIQFIANTNNGLLLIFKDGSYLYEGFTRNSMKCMIDKCKQVLNYKMNLKKSY